MARYIDADKLWKDTTTHFDYCEEYLELIEKQPTADVVEVVRCKDCVYYENFLCGRFSAYGDSIEEPECDYCSYGERREDGN